MVTSLRRSAWRRDWTTLKTTELRSGVSDTSSLRSHMTRSASWRVSSSPSALKCRRQMFGDIALLEEAVTNDVLSPFLLAALDQTDHGVDVSEVVPRLR